MSEPEFDPPNAMEPDAEYKPRRDISDASAVEYRSEDNYPVPVIEDSDVHGVDPATADSDRELVRDDEEAIDKGNIIDSRTRKAKLKGTYQEPGDEEGLAGPEDGTSAVRGGSL
ncbi:hypothetical protein ABW20_dc0108123 [Dactylellina cionopaga]|nr:hypothetical protein ABW20_dc0108123 [Dactylellina cionopaga]